MPLYQYRCKDIDCGHTQEEYRFSSKDRKWSKCSQCGIVAERAHDLEIPSIRPDIEPRFDVSTGAYITSRKDLREQLALHNAASPELPTNSYPSAGRLCAEERTELTESDSSLFDKRRKPGWGSVTNVSDDESSGITVEGDADYQAIRDEVKKQHVAKRQEGI